MKKKLPDNIAIELMKDINDGKLKTSAICEKYKEYEIKAHDVYNIIHKEYYKDLSKFV